MSSATRWLDTHLYPNHQDSWDNKLFRELLLDYLKPGDHVLDYGAGRGALPELNLRDQAALIAGVDPDDAVLRNPFLDEAKLLPLPSGQIPYDDHRFDLVLSANVMEHVQAPETVFKEIYRVLHPGGWFISKTPNKWHYVATIARLTPFSFHVFINRRRGRRVHDTFPTIYACNTPRVVRRYAHRTGFDVVQIDMWEGRPEYLRMAAVPYSVGYLYERLVNTSPALSAFRSVMVFVLQKPGGALEESIMS